jgi:hypothetical protein
MNSLLAARSATVFQTAAVETAPAIWDLHFSLDNKYLIAGGSRKQIMVNDFSSLNVAMLLEHFRYGKSIENEYALSSNMRHISIFSISLPMADSLLPFTTIQFVC